MSQQNPKGRAPVAEAGRTSGGAAPGGGASADASPTEMIPKTRGDVPAGRGADAGARPAAPAATPAAAAGATRTPPRPAAQKVEPEPAVEPETSSGKSGTVRKARLKLTRVDPWSVMKLAFALSIAVAIVTVIAIAIVWAVLGSAGVWDAVNSSVASLLSDDATTFDIRDYVGFGRVFGIALLIAAVDVVLITALATLGAFLYNIATSLLGGLEVTLAEDS